VRKTGKSEKAEAITELLTTFKEVFSSVFTGFGAEVLNLIQDRGAQVFLDLKFHDIPETVAGAVREVARHRVRMFTVHALGGSGMIRRAVSELVQMTLIPGVPVPQCLAVTVLTSHGEKDLEEIGFKGPLVEQAKLLATVAIKSGAAGVVASGHELEALRSVLPPGVIFVVPGIRGESDPTQDQARVMTARGAIEAGATYVVVGRPIRLAKHPADAAKKLVDEIAKASVA
jgi:orotidine-5'-phosphate decarboxylase